MKKLLWLLLLSPCFGQAFYQLPNPLPNALVRVCPVGTANPCPSPSAIFSNSGLSSALANPFQVGSSGNFGFWVAAGQYTIQIGQPYNQVYTISLGGGGGSAYTFFGNTMNPLTALQDPTQIVDAAGNLIDYESSFFQFSSPNGGSLVFDLNCQSGGVPGALCLFDHANSQFYMNGSGGIALCANGASCSAGGPGTITIGEGTNTVILPGGYTTTAQAALKAPLASPALTGTPIAPTAAPLTSNTQIATTAYADAAAAAAAGANKFLSNLTSPTALNQNLNFAAATMTGSSNINMGFPGTNATGQNFYDWINQTSGEIYRCSVGSTTFNSVVDDVSICGWNVNNSAGPISGSFPTIFDQVENGYKFGGAGTLTVEHHMIVQGTGGGALRYFTSQFNAVTGIDNFLNWNANNGIGFQCLTAACSLGSIGVNYFGATPTLLSTTGAITANLGATVNSTSNALTGLTITHHGAGYDVKLVADTTPANCTSNATTEIIFTGDSPTQPDNWTACGISTTAAPIRFGVSTLLNGFGLASYTGSGLGAQNIFQSTVGGGLWISNSAYTNQSNFSGFYAGNNGGGATEYVVVRNVGTSPTPVTLVDWGTIDGGVASNYFDGAVFYTGNGSGTGTLTAGVKNTTFNSATNCSSSASPAVCGSAAAGTVTLPTNAVSSSIVVNTTVVTANSEIFVQTDDTLGTKLGVTCNSTVATLVGGLTISARSAGTSFTIANNVAIVTNPLCVSYHIVN
jgi:hypothetical protein